MTTPDDFFRALDQQRADREDRRLFLVDAIDFALGHLRAADAPADYAARVERIAQDAVGIIRRDGGDDDRAALDALHGAALYAAVEEYNLMQPAVAGASTVKALAGVVRGAAAAVLTPDESPAARLVSPWRYTEEAFCSAAECAAYATLSRVTRDAHDGIVQVIFECAHSAAQEQLLALAGRQSERLHDMIYYALD